MKHMLGRSVLSIAFLASLVMLAGLAEGDPALVTSAAVAFVLAMLGWLFGAIALLVLEALDEIEGKIK